MRLQSIPFIEQLHEAFGVQFGDVSNMNGGWFSGHTGHQTGLEVDAWFSSYNDRDKPIANKLIAIINYFATNSAFRIEKILVTYDPAAQGANSFAQALRDAPLLANGRTATSMIRPAGEHGTHFHIYLRRLF